MRTILLTLVIAALPASTALAQQVSPHKPDKPVSSGKLLPTKTGDIAIWSGQHDEVRHIRMNGTHPAKLGPTPLGDSVGHWEGETLVIDTTNFTDKTAFRGSTQQLHVIERLTRVGPDLISYKFTIEDPATWSKPWSGEVMMTTIRSPIFKYACQEGNYGMPDILSGARASEKSDAGHP